MTTQPPAASSRRSRSWLWDSLGDFFNSASGGAAKAWIITLLLLMLLMNAMNVANSFVLRDFMSAIQDRHRSGFIAYAWTYAGVFAISTIIAAFLRFSEERLGLLWRGWMTRRLTATYIDGKTYLRIRSEQSLTNPDQRISEDVKSLTVTTLALTVMITNSTITVLSFSGVLWAISPTLFVVAISYALIGSAMTALLARPLVRLNYRQADLEADFRSDLVRLNQLADGIALSGLEGRTRDRLIGRVDMLVENFRRIVSVNRNVGFFTSGYNYLIQLVPIVITAPLFMNGSADFGIIGQSAMAFSTLVTSLSLIVTQFQSISAYAAVLKRLGEFTDAVRRADESQNEACVGCSKSADDFTFENLTLRTGLVEGHTLIEELDLNIPRGTRVLITGNQAAQQALFRAAAGMPVGGTGCVLRPSAEKVAFVPENPFLPPGTLRESLIAPALDEATSDEEMWTVLKAVGIDTVIARHDGSGIRHDWHELLALRDEQLMAIARAILSQPDFILLEYLNSSLNQSTELKILKLLNQRKITYLSISDQLPNPRYHDLSLELGDDGTWHVTDLRQESSMTESAK